MTNINLFPDPFQNQRFCWKNPFEDWSKAQEEAARVESQKETRTELRKKEIQREAREKRYQFSSDEDFENMKKAVDKKNELERKITARLRLLYSSLPLTAQIELEGPATTITNAINSVFYAVDGYEARIKLLDSIEKAVNAVLNSASTSFPSQEEVLKLFQEGKLREIITEKIDILVEPLKKDFDERILRMLEHMLIGVTMLLLVTVATLCAIAYLESAAVGTGIVVGSLVTSTVIGVALGYMQSLNETASRKPSAPRVREGKFFETDPKAFLYDRMNEIFPNVSREIFEKALRELRKRNVHELDAIIGDVTRGLGQ